MEAEACERPVRSRRVDIFGTISIEVFAFLCVWLRLYSRWTTTGRLEIDDYVMISCGVSGFAHFEGKRKAELTLWPRLSTRSSS